MANDLSPNACDLPAGAADTADALAGRAARWCARADALMADPNLDQGQVDRALSYLAELQHQIALCGGARPPRSFDTLKKQVRRTQIALSHAALGAKPPDGDDRVFRLVPHGAPHKGPLQPVSVSRALLDLEALRPYLTDDAIEKAIRAHAASTERHNVPGVGYAVLPDAAVFPCEIT